MSKKWRFRFQRISFGLTEEYMENIYEQFFFLKYSGGWSFSEAYNLPVGLRRWFVERLLRQLEMEQEAIQKASKGKGGQAQELTPFNEPSAPRKLY